MIAGQVNVLKLIAGCESLKLGEGIGERVYVAAGPATGLRQQGSDN
jgi:hypothetical protein